MHFPAIFQRVFTLTAILAVMFVSGGCASNRQNNSDPVAPVSSLYEGKTTRKEVLLKFGEPSQAMMAENILTYRLRRKEGYRVVSPPENNWKGVTHSLVLVFDEKSVLEKFNIVPIGGK